MGKKLPNTPRSQIKNALRGRVWLRSRERAAALKREGYCCERCHAKQSKAKGREVRVEVHHRSGRIDWTPIIDMIMERVLVHPNNLEVLCVDCHKKEHSKKG